MPSQERRRLGKMRKLLLAMLLALLLPVAIVFGLYLWIIWPPWVDACLDAGGCWDYCNDRCEHDDQAACDRCRPEPRAR
jgi:hypothetical protein